LSKLIARKSLAASQSIKMGERFGADNFTAKRPGTGISPMRWDEVLRQVAQKDYEKDEMI
jgi:N,N'-diacetyllegionaminate synthase